MIIDNTIPLEVVRQIISKYIYEKKGVRVAVPYPKTQRDYELFERMATYACNYYGL